MGLLTKILRMDAVYWAKGLPDVDGKPSVLPPVDLKVRWEDTQEQVMGPSGDIITVSTKVYVGEDLTVGGYLMLGTVKDNVSKDGFTIPSVDGAREIMVAAKTPNIPASKFLRIVYLGGKV